MLMRYQAALRSGPLVAAIIAAPAEACNAPAPAILASRSQRGGGWVDAMTTAAEDFVGLRPQGFDFLRELRDNNDPA